MVEITLTLDLEATIMDALANLQASGKKISIFIDKDGKLEGIITDGDLRRALLVGAKLSDHALRFANLAPATSNVNDSNMERNLRAARAGINSLPIIDGSRRLIEVWHRDKEHSSFTTETPVLLMAGGRGSRMMPLTQNTPKPLLRVGGMSLLEHHLTKLANQGFINVWISIHYLGDQIMEQIGDGEAYNLNISYIFENEPLGTAGALLKLPELNSDNRVVICNADVIHNHDLRRILDQHTHKKSSLTAVATKHLVQSPYGVFEEESGILTHFQEKPIREELVSAGINIIEFSVIRMFQDRKTLNIPEVYNKLLEEKMPISIYTLEDFWLDVGTENALAKANIEFETN